MIIAAYLIMGAFMDELAMILLTVPILFPVVQAIGYDPIWFGVIIVIVCQAGMIAPPVGLNVFVISGMVKDVPMADIYRGIMPFLAGDGGAARHPDGGARDRALPAAHHEVARGACRKGAASLLSSGRGRDGYAGGTATPLLRQLNIAPCCGWHPRDPLPCWCSLGRETVA